MKHKKRMTTVNQVEERIQELQMRVLGRIEKLDWSGARRISREIGQCVRRKIEMQRVAVKKLPLFQREQVT